VSGIEPDGATTA